MPNKTKYDWNKLFKKKKMILKQGRDFDCQPQSMAQQIRQRARYRGLKVSIYHCNNFRDLEVKIGGRE